MISQVISIGPFQPLDMILELPNEDQKRGENQKKSTFSETQQVRTTRCTLPFFWVNSKFKVYIGSLAFLLVGRKTKQRNSWHHFSSNTFRTVSAKVRIEIGFLTNALIPISSAFSSETSLLCPVHRITGTSGWIFKSSWASLSLVM